MDALELALRCSSLLKRTMVLDGTEPSVVESSAAEAQDESFLSPLRSRDALNESDCERHFKDYGTILHTCDKYAQYHVSKSSEIVSIERMLRLLKKWPLLMSMVIFLINERKTKKSIHIKIEPLCYAKKYMLSFCMPLFILCKHQT